MWIFSLICWMASSSFVMSGEPPKILNEYRSLIQAKVMDRVQLTCPVQQQSKDLLFSWMKDNESISISWVRLETKGAHLIIDDVEPEDSGKYVCIATNGFGSQRADILLIVTDPLTESTTTDPTAEFESSNDLLIQGLSFTEETLRQPRQVRITAGSSLDIQCGVAGYPHPDLIWLKDGVLYQRWQQNQPDETGWKVSHLTLSIRKASSGSSGNYTCLALGLKEKIQTTFIIKVLGSELPDLSQVQPSNNVTERRGGKAKFLCWVYSSSEPEVEWFKRLPSNEIHNKELNSNTSLVVGEDQYQKLDQLEEELARKADGSYLKKLLLDPLDEQDKGLYLCLGVNRYGYNIQKTYLNIQPNYETLNTTKSVPFSIMVALPSVLILSIAGGFVCWVREREKERRQAVLAALDTGWSHAYVERQQQQQQQAIESIGQQTGHTRQTLTSGTGSHLLNEQADVDLIIGKRTDDVQQQQSNYYFERHQLDQQRNTSDFKPSMIH